MLLLILDLEFPNRAVDDTCDYFTYGSSPTFIESHNRQDKNPFLAPILLVRVI
jgi:hypothetical protein